MRKQTWRDKIIDLIEREIFLSTGKRSKEHWSGECKMNDILRLVENEIEKAKKK